MWPPQIKQIKLAIEQRPTGALVDLSQVTSFGARAITALLQAIDTAVRAGGILTIRDSHHASGDRGMAPARLPWMGQPGLTAVAGADGYWAA